MENEAVLETSNAETVTISRAEYERYQKLQKLYDWLLEQLLVMNKKRFGSSSEKSDAEIYEHLILFSS